MPRFAGSFDSRRVLRPSAAPPRLVPMHRDREPRTSLGALVPTAQAEQGTIPGFAADARLRLNLQARDELGKAIAEGRDVRHCVLHIEPEGARVVNRTELAGTFRRFGVRGTAKRLERAIVPIGCVLVLVDGDEVHLTTVPIARLIDE